jgi:hypothetical protein
MTEHIRQFIDQIAAGENAEAKENLENVLSTKAFEALDAYKKELATGIFSNGQEESQIEVQETEA